MDAIQDYTAYRDVDAFAVHPHDPGVLLSGVALLRHLPDGVDAVVSLCRLGATEVPAPAVAATDHVEVWLIDSPRTDRNPHLGYVLAQAADTIAELRSRGRTVLLHCVQAQSRTPTVAAAYAIRHHGVPPQQALTEVCAALPEAHPNTAFIAALGDVAGSHRTDQQGDPR